jgi:putative lipoprotein
VTLRALGHEPEWTFEVQGTDRLIVVTQLGTARTEIAYTAPTVAGTTQTYRTTGFGHELVAAVTRAPCTDSMSGEAFDASVTLTLDGVTYRGCGRFL